MVGISGKVARRYTCQNLCNWILEGTRADLAPPLYCQFAESKHFLVYFSRNPSSNLSSGWFSISLQYLGGVNVQFNHVSLYFFIIYYKTTVAGYGCHFLPSCLHLGVGVVVPPLHNLTSHHKNLSIFRTLIIGVWFTWYRLWECSGNEGVRQVAFAVDSYGKCLQD